MRNLKAKVRKSIEKSLETVDTEYHGIQLDNSRFELCLSVIKDCSDLLEVAQNVRKVIGEKFGFSQNGRDCLWCHEQAMLNRESDFEFLTSTVYRLSVIDAPKSQQHHNTGNQYAKKDETLDAQITFRTRQQTKTALMRKKEQLGIEKLTDLMNMACEYFLANH